MEIDGESRDKKAHILPALLFFFMNLTLRMRLDRLDGIGKAVMLGEKIVPAVVKGFLSGLDEKSKIYNYGDLKIIFQEFFCQFNQDQMVAIMENVLESSPVNPVETAMIKENLKSHCRALQSSFKNC